MLTRHYFLALAAAACCAAISPAQETDADHPPVCQNNGPYLFDVANIPGTTTTAVQLSSLGSYDPDGDPLSFFWFEECPNAFFADPTQADATLTVDMAGLCTQTCVVALRVTANGVTVHCNTTVTVTDMSPPVFTSCPPDAHIMWTLQNWTLGPDAQQTGAAFATDNADPLPLVTFADQFFSDLAGTGLEGHVVRTWTAIDDCGLSSSCTQTIYLVSPKATKAPNLDLDLNACPNVFDRGISGNLDVTVLTSGGTKPFNAANIDWSTVRMQRINDTTKQMSLGSSVFTLADFGKVTATLPGQCNSATKDGKIDLRIAVDKASLITALGLDTEQPGATVEFWLTGRTVAGTHFAMHDFAIVQ